MATFNLRLDDDLVEVIDADIQNLIPRRSRNSQIEAILFAHYKEQIEALRAERESQTINKPQSRRKAA